MSIENQFNKITNHQNPEKRESIEDPHIDLVKEIMEIQKEGYSIGRGLSAEVHISKTERRICYKITHTDRKHHNNSFIEGELLGKAARIGKGVKIPQPYYSLLSESNNNKVETLVMETLNAVSIEDVLVRGVSLPEKFNLENFFTKIEGFLDQLHAAGIFHRDLNLGNIMIDRETGEPGIIDFGLATEQYIRSENPYHISDGKGNVDYVTPDEFRVKEARIALKKYIFEKNKQ